MLLNQIPELQTSSYMSIADSYNEKQLDHKRKKKEREEKNT